MLYVERDENGVIVAIRHTPGEKATEKKSVMDEELAEFLKDVSIDPWVQMLSLSDIGIIRIVEDLIDLLVRKKVILSSDLPVEAQQKLSERQQVRQHLDNHDFMVDDIL